MKTSYFGDLLEEEKLFLLPNGFDTNILMEQGIQRKLISEKEKIMITVGRIGTEQKNTELLLEVLAEVDLKDWRVYCIGPIEPEFLKKIDAFYIQHPEKKTRYASLEKYLKHRSMSITTHPKYFCLRHVQRVMPSH
jgi:glycogen synthase